MNKPLNSSQLQTWSSRAIVSTALVGALLALLFFAPQAEAAEFSSAGTVKSIMTDDTGRILFQISGDPRGLCDPRVHGEYTIPGDPSGKPNSAILGVLMAAYLAGKTVQAVGDDSNCDSLLPWRDYRFAIVNRVFLDPQP